MGRNHFFFPFPGAYYFSFFQKFIFFLYVLGTSLFSLDSNSGENVSLLGRGTSLITLKSGKILSVGAFFLRPSGVTSFNFYCHQHLPYGYFFSSVMKKWIFSGTAT